MLIAVGVAIFMSTVDMAIVQTALPSMGRSFEVTPRLGQWLIFAYTGAMIALQLPAGRWLDSVSPRSAFAFSIGGFTLASVLAAASPGVEVLLAARVLQGGFAAILGALAPVLVITGTPPSSRGRAMGLVGMLGPLGAVSGPVIGGLILSAWDWRGIFLVNVPIGAVVLYLGLRSIAGGHRLTVPGLDFLRETVAAAIAGTGLLILLTVAAERDPSWIAMGVALVAFLAAGAWWYRQPGGAAVARLLATPPLGIIVVATLGVTVVGGSLLYLPPFTLDQVIELPVAQWGLVLLCLSLGMVVASNIAGFVTDRWGSRPTGLAGAVIVLAGAVSLAVDPTFGDAVGLGVRLFITGFGMGMFQVPMQTLFMTTAPPDLRGSAGAVTNVIRQVGFSIGPAFCTLVWFAAGNGRPAGLLDAYYVPAGAGAAALLAAVYLVISESRRAVAPSATRT